MEFKGRIKRKKILVLGDVMLDEYYFGEVKRISPEAPVPVFLMDHVEHRLGGAANVAVNLARNGQDVFILSVVGQDADSQKLKDLFRENDINDEFVIESDRRTTKKTRLLAGNNQQVLRLDKENNDDIDESSKERIINTVKETINYFDIVILSDYMKGILTYDLTRNIIELCNANDVKTLVDVKGKNPLKYLGAYLLKPNKNELASITSLPVSNVQEIIKAAKKLVEICNSQYVLSTCGSDGMILTDADGQTFSMKTTSHEVYDVTGAGDTVIAYLGICLANGFEIREATGVANVAAGIKVSKVGTSPVLLREVSEYLEKNAIDIDSKLLTIDGLKKLRKAFNDKKIVFTNGCFDILHIGHVRYLREASKLGDILIVGLNNDESVKRLKGENRPINSVEERYEMLSSFGFIDYVIYFSDNTPQKIIEACRPDILVKGGDYKEEDIVGADFVKRYGGEVKILPYVEGKSTSNIISKIDIRNNKEYSCSERI